MKTAQLKILATVIALATLSACATPASTGGTIPGASAGGLATGPWSNDPHFIAPAK